MADSPPIIETLHAASAGLLFPSETDAPFEPFFWPAADTSAPLTPAAIAHFSGSLPDAPIKKMSLDTFFRPATKAESWHNADEKAEVARFTDLVKALKAMLKNPAVYRIGETAIEAYIVGAVETGYAGLKTHLVET